MPKRRSTPKPKPKPRRDRRARTQRAPSFDSLVTAILAAGRGLAKSTDPLEAELFGSLMLSMLETDPGERPERRLEVVGRLLDVLQTRRSATSLAVALALAAVLPEPWREDAQSVANAMAAEGLPLPTWAPTAGRARYVASWAMTDEFGDQDLIVASFEHEGYPPHAISLTADHNFHGLFRQAAVGVDADLILSQWSEVSPIPLRPMTARDLAGRWAAGTGWYRRYLGPPVYEDVPRVMALLEARASALPAPPEPEEPAQPTEEARRALLDRFLESQFAVGLDAGPDGPAYAVVEQLIDFRLEHGEGDPLRWSPIVVEIALLDWLPRKAVIGEEEVDVLPDVLRAFVRFAGAEKGLADADVAETLASIDQFEPEFLESMADSDSFGMGKRIALEMQRDGVDVTDPAALQAWMDAFNARPIEDRDDVLGPMPPL
jgi:hypothetical protein